MLRTPNPTRPKSIDELLDSRLISQISRLDLTSRKIFAGKLKGERRSKKRGESVEFADHRPYAIGDDLRHIDWNIYARLDHLFMKLFLEEEDLSLHIVIDCSESADCGDPGKFLFMQRLAMALGYIGLVNLNRVAITALAGELATDQPREKPVGTGSVFAPSPLPSGGTGVPPVSSPSTLHTIRDLRGRRRTQDLARFICSLRPSGSTDFTEAAKRIALTRRGKGVMLVLSDFFMKEGYETGLRLLVGRGYDLFAMQILAPQEVEPDIAGDLRLRDVEDFDQAEVTITAPLLKRYKQTLAAYCGELRDFCARREITHLSVRTDTPIETLIMDYLRQRGLLR
ncbi:MAG: DUF58 domain-containing protein [Phycisphaerales bacterium]